MKYYNTDVLNDAVTVLYATRGFYTEEGIDTIVREFYDYSENSNISEYARERLFDDYLDMEYEDLITNFENGFKVLSILIMEVKTWRGVRTGFKILNPCTIREVIQGYGCDDFAIYLDNYNIKFIGYHHDSDGIPNKGTFREIVKMPGNMDLNTLGYKILNVRSATSTYTASMRKYIFDVFGKPMTKSEIKKLKKGKKGGKNNVT